MKSFRIAYPTLIVAIVLWAAGAQELSVDVPSMSEAANQVRHGIADVVDFLLEPIGLY